MITLEDYYEYDGPETCCIFDAVLVDGKCPECYRDYED